MISAHTCPTCTFSYTCLSSLLNEVMTCSYIHARKSNFIRPRAPRQLYEAPTEHKSALQQANSFRRGWNAEKRPERVEQRATEIAFYSHAFVRCIKKEEPYTIWFGGLSILILFFNRVTLHWGVQKNLASMITKAHLFVTNCSFFLLSQRGRNSDYLDHGIQKNSCCYLNRD